MNNNTIVCSFPSLLRRCAKQCTDGAVVLMASLFFLTSSHENSTAALIQRPPCATCIRLNGVSLFEGGSFCDMCPLVHRAVMITGVAAVTCANSCHLPLPRLLLVATHIRGWEAMVACIYRSVVERPCRSVVARPCCHAGPWLGGYVAMQVHGWEAMAACRSIVGRSRWPVFVTACWAHTAVGR